MSRDDIEITRRTLANGVTVRVLLDQFGGTDSPFEYSDESVRFLEFGRDCYDSWGKTRNGRRDSFPFESPKEAVQWAKENRFIVYPVFKFDHSGVAYSVRPFSCPWDSGQCGYLMLSRKEWPRRGTKSDSYAEAVISEFSSWANGDIYGFVVEDSDGETLDSCWGFIGDSDYCLEEGISVGEDHAKQIGESRAVAFAESSIAERPDMYQAGEGVAA